MAGVGEGPLGTTLHSSATKVSTLNYPIKFSPSSTSSFETQNQINYNMTTLGIAPFASSNPTDLPPQFFEPLAQNLEPIVDAMKAYNKFLGEI